MGGGGRHCGQVEEAIGEGLEQPLLPAIAAVGVLENRGEDEFVPLHRIGRAVVVVGLEAMAAVEVKLPVVLAGGVAAQPPARTKADVVVDRAVVNQRAQPGVIVAHVARLGGRRDMLGIGHVGGVGDQLVNSHRPHLAEVVGVPNAFVPRCAGPDRAAPCRRTVVDVEGKVGLRVFPVGRGDRPPPAICRLDAVADQVAMDAHIARHLRRVKARLNLLHSHRRPVGRVGRVGQANVAARRHILQEHAHTGHAVVVGNPDTNLHRVEGCGRRGQMLHRGDKGRRVVQPRAIGPAR